MKSRSEFLGRIDFRGMRQVAEIHHDRLFNEVIEPLALVLLTDPLLEQLICRAHNDGDE